MISGFLKKLLFARQFSMMDGKIEVLGKRHVMLPSDLLFSIQSSKEEIYTVSKKKSLENMKYLGSKLGASQESMLNNIKNIYETFGLGPLELADLKNKQKQAVVVIRGSPSASVHAKEPQCILISGILAGMFSYFFAQDIDVEEKKCSATGALFCEFNVGKRGKK